MRTGRLTVLVCGLLAVGILAVWPGSAAAGWLTTSVDIDFTGDSAVGDHSDTVTVVTPGFEIEVGDGSNIGNNVMLSDEYINLEDVDATHAYIQLQVHGGGDAHSEDYQDMGLEPTANYHFTFDSSGLPVADVTDIILTDVIGVAEGTEVTYTTGEHWLNLIIGTLGIDAVPDLGTIRIDVLLGFTVPPTADAGPDLVYSAGTLSVTADGTGSSDPDGTIDSYLWDKGSAPTLALNPVSLAQSGLTSPTDTSTISLTVTDNDNEQDTDTAGILYTNASPVAAAGSDLVYDATMGARTADASGIIDPDPDLAANDQVPGFEALSYGWTTGTTPAAATNPITFAQAIAAGMTQTADGTASLTVTDRAGATDGDSILLTYSSAPPTADAGPALVYDATMAAQVADGSGSSDPDLAVNAVVPGFESLTYSWSTGATPGAVMNSIGFAQAIAAGMTRTADGAGSLTVTDSTGGSSSDNVALTYADDPAAILWFTAAVSGDVVQFGFEVQDNDLVVNAASPLWQALALEIDDVQAASEADVAVAGAYWFANYAGTDPLVNADDVGGSPTIDLPLIMFPPGDNEVWLNIAGSYDTASVTFYNHIPEPATLTLLALAGAGLWRRRRLERRAAA